MSAYFERLRQEALQQGLQEGRREAAFAIVLRQLQRKFGELPQEVLQRVGQADPDILIAWSGRIMTAERIDEVLY